MISTLMLLAIALLVNVAFAEISVVMTMMLRDEAVNIRANLPLWVDSIKYFVFMVDNRTKDDTIQAIADVLKGKREYRNLSYQFEGFGPARTESLTAAWDHFPQASHVWIADPDWRPEVDTININQLNLIAEAFRFKIFDRNGFSTRRCDWLLRHRKGLKMKFHLHEVLDIGDLYIHMAVDFVVREIEKAGTWHETVGHGNSMSAPRYLFDLSMLEKDLIAYPDAPHTHYYVGVTHEAYASQLVTDGMPNDELVLKHMNLALKYMHMRLAGYYDNEFVEERWGIMLETGQTYQEHKSDFVSAERYLSLGRDFSLHQVECCMALVRLYLQNGNVMLASNQLANALLISPKDRIMMNHFRIWECDLPVFILEMFGYHNIVTTDNDVKLKLMDKDHALYMVMMLHMARKPTCVGHRPYDLTFSGPIFDLMMNSFKRFDIMISDKTLKADAEKLCFNSEFLAFLDRKQYKLHVCDEFKQIQVQKVYCESFNAFTPPPVEDYQVLHHGQFIGAASLADIISHAHGGDMELLLTPGVQKFKVLFAEHFNPRMIYALIGAMKRPHLQTIVTAIEIVVLTPRQDLIMEIKARVSACEYVDIQFIQSSVEDIFDNPKMSEAVINQYRDYFNYIEYYGGSGGASNVASHMKLLKRWLDATGVIGYTHFTKNIHVDNLTRMLKNRNTFAHNPFSVEAERLVKGYLTYTRDLAYLNRDEVLIQFLSTLHEGNSSNAFTLSDLEGIISQSGMKMTSIFPTAFAKPFDEMRHYAPLQFQEYGLDNEEFVYSMVISFRRTVYLVKADSPKVKQLNRASIESILPHVLLNRKQMTKERSFNKHVADKIMVMDRSGYFGKLLSPGDSFASLGQSMSISVSPSSAPLFNLSYIFVPTILKGLSKLQNRLSIGEMMEHNIQQMFSSSGNERTEAHILKMHWALLNALQFLEQTNYISFIWSNKALVEFKSPADYPDTYNPKWETIFRLPKDHLGNRSTGIEVDNSSVEVVSNGEQYKVPDISKPVEVTKVAPNAVETPIAKSTSTKSTKSPKDYVKNMLNKGSNNDRKDTVDTVVPPRKEDDTKYTVTTEGVQSNQGGLNIFTSSKAPSKRDSEVHVDQKAVTGSAIPSDNAEFEARIASLRKLGVPEAVIQRTREDFEKEKTSANTGAGDKSIPDDSVAPMSKNTKVDIPTVNSAAESVSGISSEKLPDKVPKLKKSSKDGDAKGSKDGKEKSKKNKKPMASPIAPAVKVRPKSEVPLLCVQQLKEQLLSSYRDPECGLKGKSVGKSHCEKPINSKYNRRSADLTSMSGMKIKFDISQLRYIALVDVMNAQKIAHQVLPKFQNINKLISHMARYVAVTSVRQSFHITESEYDAVADGIINRAIHIAKDPYAVANPVDIPEQIVYEVARNNIISSDMDIGDSDYLVVDQVINVNSLKLMGSILLTSTVWFDVMNGQMVGAYYDDGLIHKIFPLFSQEIADTLSTRHMYKIKKYFAVAMDLSSTEQSWGPIFMADEDELMVVTWVNPNAVPAEENTDTDGIFIYDTIANDAFPSFVKTYPAIHPDYITDMNENHTNPVDIALSTDLNLEMHYSNLSRDFISRHNNRLLLVGSNRPFYLSTSNKKDNFYKETLGRKSFDQRTMIAFIIVLTKA